MKQQKGMATRAQRKPSWTEYLAALMDSLRIHFFALPAAAVCAGAASAEEPRRAGAVGIAATAAALGWGAAQLLNDLLDVEADAIDAPNRAAPRGLLPTAPTLTLGAIMAIGITAALVSLHSAAIWLAAPAALLVLGYGFAKRIPGGGNVAHGALMGTAALLGSAAATPSLPLEAIVLRCIDMALLSGTWAALYLQANYEKDRVGDRAAGNHTLAHLLGLKLSGLLRAVLASLWCAWAWSTTAESSRLLLAVSLVLVLISSAFTIHGNTEVSALKGYRFAVHGAVLGLLALAAPILGDLGLLIAVLVSASLIEMAFLRSSNP